MNPGSKIALVSQILNPYKQPCNATRAVRVPAHTPYTTGEPGLGSRDWGAQPGLGGEAGTGEPSRDLGGSRDWGGAGTGEPSRDWGAGTGEPELGSRAGTGELGLGRETGLGSRAGTGEPSRDRGAQPGLGSPAGTGEPSRDWGAEPGQGNPAGTGGGDWGAQPGLGIPGLGREGAESMIYQHCKIPCTATLTT